MIRALELGNQLFDLSVGFEKMAAFLSISLLPRVVRQAGYSPDLGGLFLPTLGILFSPQPLAVGTCSFKT